MESINDQVNEKKMESMKNERVHGRYWWSSRNMNEEGRTVWATMAWALSFTQSVGVRQGAANVLGAGWKKIPGWLGYQELVSDNKGN